jgi:hypothetical protein
MGDKRKAFTYHPSPITYHFPYSLFVYPVVVGGYQGVFL